MSYLRKIEYCITPNDSFKVIHNCSGCGRKMHFINTKCFRVNANGNRIDVWLIYQCEKCKHTLNLTVYERQNPSRIPVDDYQKFLANDEELALKYGKDSAFFSANRVDVDWAEIPYTYMICVDGKLELMSVDNTMSPNEAGQIVIHNSYGIKVRPEKQVAEVLQLSRSQVKKLTDIGELEIIQEKGKVIINQAISQ